MDLTESIAPRSDQLNADDLMAGPRTVTITEVNRGTAEQPVNVVLAEFGPGRPYKPSKSMRRVMVAAWGKEASAYTGHRLTLFRNPSIKFGKDEVGGIQISHLSHIDKPLTIALTVTRGKRAPYVVQPLADSPADVITSDQMRRMQQLFAEKGPESPAERLAYVGTVLGEPVASAKSLSRDQADAVIAALTNLGDDEPEGGQDDPMLDGLEQ
jgi:hypothetical protein